MRKRNPQSSHKHTPAKLKGRLMRGRVHCDSFSESILKAMRPEAFWKEHLFCHTHTAMLDCAHGDQKEIQQEVSKLKETCQAEAAGTEEKDFP
jgi:hypothetical protein